MFECLTIGFRIHVYHRFFTTLIIYRFYPCLSRISGGTGLIGDIGCLSSEAPTTRDMPYV
jgi:hypothetical protein